MTTESPDLPALPEPFFASWSRGGLLSADGYTADQMLAFRAEAIAAKDAEIARLSAAFEDECNRTDSLLTILGLPAERCRSEGGSLIPRKVLTLMGEAKVSAALAAQQPAADMDAHFDRHLEFYALRHPSLLVRQLAQRMLAVAPTAAPSAPSAQPVAVPQGWWLAPEEPTLPMLDALRSDTTPNLRQRYAAMRAAAPSAPQPETKGDAA